MFFCYIFTAFASEAQPEEIRPIQSRIRQNTHDCTAELLAADCRSPSAVI